MIDKEPPILICSLLLKYFTLLPIEQANIFGIRQEEALGRRSGAAAAARSSGSWRDVSSVRRQGDNLVKRVLKNEGLGR